MADLTGQSVSSTYPLLLKIESAPIGTTFKTIESGDGTDSALQLATTGIKSQGTIESTGAAAIGGAITVTGLSTLNAGATITGAATVSSTLAVTGATTLLSTLAVTGATNVAGITASGTLTAAQIVTSGFVDGRDVSVDGAALDAGVATINARTALNTASTIVARDASGNFAAGAITATAIAGPVNGTVGAVTPAAGSFTTVAASGAITGNLTGNVTGNVTGSAGSCTGNSATATTTTGNSATATILAAPRDISLTGAVTGTASFDGSANVSISTTVSGVTPQDVSDQSNTSTGYFDIPSGTTGQRPASPTTGWIRFNTTTGNIESHNGTAWASISVVPAVEVLHLTTTSSTAFTANTITDVANMTLSITPSSITSRVRVEVRWAGETNTAYDVLMGLKRDSTSIGSAASVGARNFGIAPLQNSHTGDNNDTTPEQCSFVYIDSPATTSSVNYKLTVRGSATQTLYTNRTINDSDSSNRERMTSTIILTEILA